MVRQAKAALAWCKRVTLGKVVGDKDISMSLELNTLEIIQRCLEAADFTGVESVVTVLQQQVGIDGCILGFKERFDGCLVDDSYITSFGIAAEWLQLYKSQRLDASDPVAQVAFDVQQPLSWALAYRHAQPSSRDFIALSRDFGLVDGMSCATKSNRFSGAASCASAILQRGLSAPQATMLRHILPHLNEAIARPALWSFGNLTERETEILKWIQIGKSSWEISVILAVSERTVKFHLNNIYRKLDVHNRAQAVARALRLGLISF